MQCWIAWSEEGVRLAHAFRWEHRYKGLKLAQLLGQTWCRYHLVGGVVDARGRLVEDECPRPLEQGASEANELPLPDRLCGEERSCLRRVVESQGYC